VEKKLSADALQNTAGSNVTPPVPLAPGSGQIVVDNTTGTGTGVKDAVVAYINGHVIDPSTGTGKQEQITGTEGFESPRDGSSSRSLKARCAGQIDAVSAIHVLHEPRTIETRRGGFPSVAVRSTKVLLGCGEHAGRTGASRGRRPGPGCG
jgi:hypothetical protein